MAKSSELFEREAKILAKLNHPSIPRYLDFFTLDTPEDRKFYLVQELAQGKSLEVKVREGWRTNEETLRVIAKELLEILIYLQSFNPPVIHRDIKPGNIIYSETENKVYLVDFGAVQNTYYTTMMRGSTVVGTYGYMAPEQFLGIATEASDLYGLGATLLYLLTGINPTELPTERLEIKFRGKVQITESLADWLEEMLAPDLEKRFTNASEALKGLKRNKKIKQSNKISWPVIAVTSLILMLSGGGIYQVNKYKYPILVNLGYGQTLLYYYGAIHNKNPELAELLINNGADVNVTDKEGNTPLDYATTPEMKQLLLNQPNK